MDFTDLIKTIGTYAPKLAAGIAGGPVGVGAAIGSIIADKFGGDISKPDELSKIIKSDPAASVKMLEIQSSLKLELEKLRVQEAMREMDFDEKTQSANLTHTENVLKTDMEDRANAREENNKNTKIVDQAIKVLVILFICFSTYKCLDMIAKNEITGTEGNIVYMFLGQMLTVFVAIAFSYWGRAESIRFNDEFKQKNA